MSRGGKREGAGRPAGTPNKATLARQAEVAASGLTPLDFMLSILRDDTKDEGARFEAAKAAAPYVHPRLSTVDASVEGGLRIEIVDDYDDGPASE